MFSKHILVIEDDEDDQFIFSEIIKDISNDDYVIQTAWNGRDALNILSGKSFVPDIIA